MKLPPAPVVPQPKRDELVDLFDKVKFHPLSIRVLAQQLKTRRPVELGPRLEHLIAARKTSASSAATDTTLPELVASLQFSLDQLDETTRQVLPRLGVFQGGAMDSLSCLKSQRYAKMSGLRSGSNWRPRPSLRRRQFQALNRPFLRFHPNARSYALGATQQRRAGRTELGPSPTDIMVSLVSSIMNTLRISVGLGPSLGSSYPTFSTLYTRHWMSVRLRRSILPTV